MGHGTDGTGTKLNVGTGTTFFRFIGTGTTNVGTGTVPVPEEFLVPVPVLFFRKITLKNPSKSSILYTFKAKKICARFASANV